MAGPIEATIDTYIRAWGERDPARRAALVEACFAEGGRMVGPSPEVNGRAALVALMTRVHAGPPWRRIRLTTVVDVRAPAFRFGGVVEYEDGTTGENFDSGVVDAEGKISLLMTFVDPLRAASEPGGV